ncbi:unnamed protein product [Penicillium olsonii]|nr:unnamed protein product [Penicillium olsonii]
MVCTHRVNACSVLKSVDFDLDLDLHAIWQESSGIPIPPPCLATDSGNPRHILSDTGNPSVYETQGFFVIECFLHPTCEKLSAFKWMGPDPLSVSTQASDIFFFMSVFAFPTEVHCIEFRPVQFDRKSGEITEGYLFFLPQFETPAWNLRWVRERLLDVISWHGFDATRIGFQLFLWPCMKPIQCSIQS